jgi:hypothetical protein
MLIPIAAVAALAAGQTGAATRLLQGHRFVTHWASSVSDATIDRSADLCRDGSFSYHSTFLYPAADELQEQTVTGRWNVVSAHLRGRLGTATVRYRGDDGSRGVVHFRATRRGVYVEGVLAEVVRARC